MQPVVYVYLKVKFRAFGITFGTVTKSWTEPVPFPVTLHKLVDFDERGIRLIVEFK